MSKNPFSLYDFLGYAFPGAISIILFWFILRVSPNSIYDLLNNNNDNLFSLFKPNNLILLILASYVAGHLFAYLSSLIVERFSLWNYDYPSSYLMAEEPQKNNLFNFKNLEIVKIFWRIIFCFVLFPISICSFLIGKCLRINSYVIRSLDETTQRHLKEKYPGLLKKLNLSVSNKETLNNYDYHRIIYHYEYEKQSKHSKKMDNYVALYGFLRSLALIFTLFFDCLLIKGILSINWRMPINWEMIIFITICGLIAYTFYLGFIKFYRRFTLESFMALITDPDI